MIEPYVMTAQDVVSVYEREADAARNGHPRCSSQYGEFRCLRHDGHDKGNHRYMHVAVFVDGPDRVGIISWETHEAIGVSVQKKEET